MNIVSEKECGALKGAVDMLLGLAAAAIFFTIGLPVVLVVDAFRPSTPTEGFDRV